MYPHLKGLDFVNPFHQKVDLLIGQYYASCFIPLDVCKGKKNEPYAILTPLGYALNVINGIDKHHKLFVSHLISMTTIEHDINTLWEIDQCDLSSSGCSLEDNQVLALWDEESVLVDNHWTIPILWKDKTVAKNNNYDQAKARLLSLQKSLKKKSILTEYDHVVKKLIDDGYAEYVRDRGTEGRI